VATSNAAQNQAFRIGRAVYGTQFHFEADRQMVQEWSSTYAEMLQSSEPDWPQRHPEQAAAKGGQADAAGLTLARAWVAAITTRHA